jgi:hypothetical protein
MQGWGAVVNAPRPRHGQEAAISQDIAALIGGRSNVAASSSKRAVLLEQ